MRWRLIASCLIAGGASLAATGRAAAQTTPPPTGDTPLEPVFKPNDAPAAPTDPGTSANEKILLAPGATAPDVPPAPPADPAPAPDAEPLDPIGERETPPRSRPAPAPAALDVRSGLQYDRGLIYISPDDMFAMKINGFFQFRYRFRDNETGESDSDWGVERVRISMVGRALSDLLRFKLQAASDGGELGRLRYAWAEARIVKWSENSELRIRGGQDKTLFGREFIVPSERLQFIDRSLVSDNFALDFQTGVLLHARLSNALFFAAGVYNGNGINKAENDSNGHLYVGRASLTLLGRGAPMIQSDTRVSERPYLNVGIGGYIRRDIKVFEGGVLLAQFDEVSGATVDATFRYGGLSLMYEVHTRRNETTRIDETGWVVQGGLMLGRRFELTGRYGWFDDNDDSEGLQELRGGVNFFFSPDEGLAHRYKLQFDAGQIKDELTDETDFEVRAQLSLHF